MDTGFLGVSRPQQAFHRLTRSALRLLAVLTTTTLVGAGLTLVGTTPARGLQASTALSTSVSTTRIDDYEKRVQRLVNKRRANHGLRRLRLADCPEGTARRWSRHLAEEGDFYHQSMTRVLDRCDAVYAGETLGRGTMSPRKLVRMWMHSSGHRAVLLSTKSRRIGIGASVMTDGRWVVAANFIRF